jgi:phosphatidylglycerophosphate synthase
METAAFILATDERGLERVYGSPVVRRLVLMMHRAGISSVHLIGRASLYTSALRDLIPATAFHEAPDPDSLTRIVEEIPLQEKQRVLLMKANLVTDRSLLARMLERGGEEGEVVFMSGVVGSISDGLSLVRRSYVVSILQALWSDREDSQAWDKRSVMEGAWGLPCGLHEGVEGMRVSEARLLDALAGQKNDDGFLARHVDRRVSRFFSKRLARTSVTPNQITLFGVMVGLLGAFFISRADYGSHLLGALLFLACVVVDGMDGEVARLKLLQSEFGHYLDVISDNVVHVAIFACMALGLFRQTGDAVYVKAFLFMLAGFGLCLVSVYYNILKRDPDDLARSPATLRLMALMANRDFAYLVVALAVIDRLNWFLMGAAAGTFIFSAVLWGVGLRERSRMRKDVDEQLPKNVQMQGARHPEE